MSKILIDEALVRQLDDAIERYFSAADRDEEMEAEDDLLEFRSALRQALEQPAPAQEPDPDELTIAYMSGLHEGKKRKPWVNLTVDELIDLEHKHRKHEDLVRAIEAKLKEKNA